MTSVTVAVLSWAAIELAPQIAAIINASD